MAAFPKKGYTYSDFESCAGKVARVSAAAARNSL